MLSAMLSTVRSILVTTPPLARQSDDARELLLIVTQPAAVQPHREQDAEVGALLIGCHVRGVGQELGDVDRHARELGQVHPPPLGFIPKSVPRMSTMTSVAWARTAIAASWLSAPNIISFTGTPMLVKSKWWVLPSFMYSHACAGMPMMTTGTPSPCPS